MSLQVLLGGNAQGAIRAIEEVNLTLNEQKAVLTNLRREYAALSTEQARNSVGKELAADIRIASSEIKRLEAAGTSSFGAIGSGATKALSSLRSLAYILPGVGVAGILNFAVEGVASLFKVSQEADKTAEKIKNLLKPINDLTSELRAAATTDTLGDVTKVTALTAVVLDQTKSYTERNRALLELKEINKGYFGDLTLEAASLALVKGRVEEYTQALLNRAIIEGFTDEIKKVSVELNEQTKNFRQISIAKAAYDEQLKNVSPDAQRAGKSTLAYEKQLEIIVGLKNRLNELKDAASKAIEESLKFKPLKPFTLDVDDKKIKEKLSKPFLFKGFVTLELTELAKINFPELVGKGINFEKFKDDLEKKLKDGFGEFKPLDLELPVAVKLRLEKKFLGVEKLKEDLNSLFKSFSVDITSAFAEELGNAISGDSAAFKDGFKAIINIIGEELKRIGKALIEFGVVKLGLDKILSNPLLIGGGTAIALGVLAIASGQLVKALAVPKFAEGGIINRATLGIVGEKGAEVIMPLNRLPQMLGGMGGQNIHITGEFVQRGNDMVSTITRVLRSQNRTMGRGAFG